MVALSVQSWEYLFVAKGLIVNKMSQSGTIIRSSQLQSALLNEFAQGGLTVLVGSNITTAVGWGGEEWVQGGTKFRWVPMSQEGLAKSDCKY